MIFYIDENKCKQQNISVGTALYLAALYHGDFIDKDNFTEICNKGYLEYKGYDIRGKLIEPKLTQQGIDIVETLFINSEIPDKESSIKILAETLKGIFPAGKKPGTNLYWAEGVALIEKRLKLFYKKYGKNFSSDDIIIAATNYVKDNTSNNYSIMRVLKYFIFKETRNALGEVESISDLLTYLENAGQEESLGIDWTSTLK